MKLILNNLSKSFNKKEVLNNINFTFESSKIYCLLGRNGVGKTTLFNCLDGLLEYKGKVSLDYNDTLTTDNLGFIPTNSIIPEFLTGYQFIKYFMDLHNLNNIDINCYLNLIEFTKEDLNKLIKEYSLGMKQKLQILVYILLKPDILLLDEPLMNIDIITAKEIKDLLKKIKKNRIIIISTHILELAKTLSNEIVILNNGKLTLLDNKNIKEQDIMEMLK